MILFSVTRLDENLNVKKHAKIFKKNECEAFRNTLPKKWIQGFVEVPEDYNDLNSKKIKVFYYGQLFSNGTPTVFFNGGPGANSHGTYSALSEKYETPLSVILIDQRGTGCSAPYPNGNTEEVIKRLSHYGSTEIVLDAEKIKINLIGTKKWNIFGQSYGGYIVHRYLLVAPQSVNATFAHAAAIGVSGPEIMKNRVFAQLRVLKEYLSWYPTDRERFNVLIEYLKPNICFKTNSENAPKICGLSLLFFFQELIASQSQWSFAHSWLEQLVNDKTVNRDGLVNFQKKFVSPEEISREFIAGYTIGWIELNYMEATFEMCYRLQLDLKAAGPEKDLGFLQDCAPILQAGKTAEMSVEQGNLLMKIMNLKKKDLSVSKLRKTLQRYKLLNFYLYSGQLDPLVPSESFEHEVTQLRGLANFHYTNFMFSGHGGFRTEQKAWADLEQESRSHP